jgi:glutamyl-tRNA synthetase
MPARSTRIHFEDLCLGPQDEDLATGAADFVLRRADGVHAYQLAVVVDDGMMGMSHVIRGADLLSSTARQIWLHRLLGYTEPRFGHVPLLLGSDGHRLSKRHAALSIARLRARGTRPEQIVGALAYRAGLIGREEPAMPQDLVDLLDLSRLPREPIVIDEQDFP